MKTIKKIKDVLIFLSILALAVIIILLGIKIFFYLLYLLLKYPLYFLITFFLLAITMYIRKTFKTK
jgi:hypothetical protein